MTIRLTIFGDLNTVFDVIDAKVKVRLQEKVDASGLRDLVTIHSMYRDTAGRQATSWFIEVLYEGKTQAGL